MEAFVAEWEATTQRIIESVNICMEEAKKTESEVEAFATEWEATTQRIIESVDLLGKRFARWHARYLSHKVSPSEEGLENIEIICELYSKCNVVYKGLLEKYHIHVETPIVEPTKESLSPDLLIKTERTSVDVARKLNALRDAWNSLPPKVQELIMKYFSRKGMAVLVILGGKILKHGKLTPGGWLLSILTSLGPWVFDILRRKGPKASTKLWVSLNLKWIKKDIRRHANAACEKFKKELSQRLTSLEEK